MIAMKSTLRTSLLTLGLLAAATMGFGQSTNASVPTMPPIRPLPPAVRGHVSDTLRALLQQFKAGREQFVADRKVLIESLKNATKDERKQLIQQFRDQEKSRVADQRALAKQIRTELKAMRDARKQAHGGG